jgi:MFS family permease
MSWFTMPALLGPLLGPPLAGLVLSIASWRWIFFLNLPIGLIGMVAVLRFVPDLRQTHPGPFDCVGFAACAVAVAAVVMFTEVWGSGLASAVVGTLLVIFGTGAGILLLRTSRSRANPLLDFRVLSYPTYDAGLIGSLISRLAMGPTALLMPLPLQESMGWSPLRASWAMVAGGLGALTCKLFAPRILSRFGFRRVLVWTCLMSIAAGAIPATFRPGLPLLLVAGALAIAGFVRALQFAASNTISYAALPDALITKASTMGTVAQQVGSALASAWAVCCWAPSAVQMQHSRPTALPGLSLSLERSAWRRFPFTLVSRLRLVTPSDPPASLQADIGARPPRFCIFAGARPCGGCIGR